MTRTIGIILSGCGFKDGSEIHESVLTLLAVTKQGAIPRFFAPAGPQASVVNHQQGTLDTQERSMIVEAARIARGEISDIASCNISELDAIIFPGGFGAAKNLSTFALQGSHCTVHPEVERVIREAHAARKPLGFICIAPAIAARVLGKHGVQLTIGNDAATAHALESMGAKHVDRPVDGVVVDAQNRVVSTPAYMFHTTIDKCEAGISALVGEVLKLCAK